jgi:hypothetical protein
MNELLAYYALLCLLLSSFGLLGSTLGCKAKGLAIASP